MKICFMGDGNSVHIKRWIEFFKGKGHQVSLITFSDVEYSDIQVCKIGSVSIKEKGGNWKYLLHNKEIKNALRIINPDIVNAHYITSYGFMSALSGFKPLVLSAWGSDVLVTAKRNFIYKNITKYALNKAELVTAESHFLTEEINKLDKVKVLTVPMGVDKKVANYERKSQGVDGEVSILSLRALVPNSNIDVIVKGVKLFKDRNQGKKVKLIITNDGSQKDYIRDLANRLGLEEEVELRGFVSREELIDLYLSTDIHITVPTSDSTSVTLLEAMLCGTVNIVSNIPANREWIVDGENGVIVPETSEIELAKGIERALEERHLKVDGAKINRDLIMKKAIWEDNMARVEEEYLNIIKTR